MQELLLKINGGKDFVIITPQMLSALIVQIHRLPERELRVAVKEILPEDLEKYIEKIINTNRFTASCFRYSHILEDPITKKELHRILRGQLEVMEMNQTACFHSIVLADTISGEAGFDIACTEPFFWACKDSMVKFAYVCPDGEQETLVLEYGEQSFASVGNRRK